jgi:SnoaL-like domain
MDDDEVRTRLGVMRTIASYTRFLDTGQVERYAALFGETGILESPARRSTGAAEISAGLGSTADKFRGVEGFMPSHHHVSSVYVETVDRDHAMGSSYFLLMSGNGPDHWGRYLDEFVRVGEEWLFSRRRVFIAGSVAASPVADQVGRRPSP